jgi:uncharacterized protein YecE (DUF72 family)
MMPGSPARPQPLAGAPVTMGRCRVLAGASSWSDRSCAPQRSFYPSRSLTAAERLAYYAGRLPLAEVATTYRFPPTPELSRRWASSVPSAFTFDLRAWSLLSGAPTWPESLWPDLHGHVRPSRREGAKLYRDRLPAGVVDECWARFRHSLSPLADAGVLGAVVFRYPSWFSPRPAAWEELAVLPERMPGFSLAVDLASERWFEGDTCERTLGFLEELGLAFVCRAFPVSAGSRRPGVLAATTDLGLLRFVAPLWWRSSRFGPAELSAWLPAIEELASCTSEVHLVMDSSQGADAAHDASRLLALLADRDVEAADLDVRASSH